MDDKQELDALKKRVQKHYNRIFSTLSPQHAEEDVKWTKEEELCLSEMFQIKEYVKDNALKVFSQRPSQDESTLKRISQLTDEAHLVKKAKTLYSKLTVGLEQDAHFPRYEEYLSALKKIHSNIREDQKLQIFDRARSYIKNRIQTIEEQHLKVQQELVSMRIDRSWDLVEAATRSSTENAYEYNKKLTFLQDVLTKHLKPLEQEELSLEQQGMLREIIERFESAIADLLAIKDQF